MNIITNHNIGNPTGERRRRSKTIKTTIVKAY